MPDADQDPIIQVFLAFKAYMSEHTGMSWSQIERILEVEREYWRSHPEAADLVRDLLT